MNNKTFLALFAIIITSIGSVAMAGLTLISTAMAQEDNATMTGNMTLGAGNTTDSNMTNGTGNISGVKDPF